MSLWDFSRRFTTAARLVAVPAPAMTDELVNYTVGGATGWGRRHARAGGRVGAGP